MMQFASTNDYLEFNGKVKNEILKQQYKQNASTHGYR